MDYTTFETRALQALQDRSQWDIHAPSIIERGLWASWTTGGITGGSYMGTDASDYRPVEPEPEPDLVELDHILEALTPELTYLQYRRIEREVLQRDEDRDRGGDYYGNHSTQSRKGFRLQDLHALLDEMGVLLD